ncbi:hypothetical protein P3339_20670 [Microbulbifer sp. MLAF003]|uniref:hypothetical protein n=1 Tax=Microbulbifer sp. MLAF003 TaxID=3032582 RepID=UPI0024AE39C2|nr:hypothetical protein [Microbulbifer sp. MLAF003]WHI50808.1 hypothetical protein P3339_20670 [Microbulbifer sp. MLAF003]
MSLGLTFSVACSEELHRISEEEVAADIAGAFIGRAFLEFFLVVVMYGLCLKGLIANLNPVTIQYC